MYNTIILVPYRDRLEHMKYFIENSVPLLQKHIPNGKVVIIEQDWNNKLFNRGCLLNIGVKEYQNKTVHCMTHDIDINPNENMILKYYIDPIPENTIKGIFTSICDTLGGIIKFRSDTFFNINGFPNDIWGWGHEDKALQNRAVFKNLKINKNILSNDPNISNYLLRFNDIDDRITSSNVGLLYNKYYNNKTNINDLMSSGLNNLQYTILERKNINDYVELIKVSI